MPAQERVGLDEQQGGPPVPDAAGQEYQQRAIGRGAARALDASIEDGELLAQERVLGHQRGFTPRQIGEGADSQGRDNWARGARTVRKLVSRRLT